MRERIIIALGTRDQHQTQLLAGEKNPRIKNWRKAKASASGGAGRIQTHNLGRYSRGCTYTHYEYTATQQSWGVLINEGKSLAGRIGRHGFRLQAPKGYLFSADELGAKLVAVADPRKDYHFNSNEVAEGVPAMMRRFRENLRLQKESRKAEAQAKRDLAIYKREVGTVRVTLDDSRRAGNCVEGSLQYAESRMGLSRQEILDGGHLFSVPAKRLLTVNGHAGVQRAVQQAWLRETTISI
jgi:hypothetical protein